jgi:hypothetical protein
LFETQKDDKYLGYLDPPEDDTEEMAVGSDTSHEGSEGNPAENGIISEAMDQKHEMDNEIPVDEGYNKKDGIQFPLQLAGQSLMPGEQKADAYRPEERYVPDEVILDPDNFEYFKGVSS